MDTPTPPPWTIVPIDGGYQVIGPTEDWPHPDGRNVPHPRQRVICTVHGTDSESRANAELIAAIGNATAVASG